MKEDQLIDKILKLLPNIGVPVFLSIVITIIGLIWVENTLVFVKILLTQLVVLLVLMLTDKIFKEIKRKEKNE